MTTRHLTLPLCCLFAAFLARAASNSEEWPIREQENIDRFLPLRDQPLRVIVDNVEGYVHVIGTTGSQVHLRAHKTIRSETPNDLAVAKREVQLLITEKPGSLSLYYDAPWRCSSEHSSCHGEFRHFYTVVFDMDVEVPRDARIVVSTVNNGDIRIEKTSGDFEVRGVNGGITMNDLAGSGEVGTVNGPVTVHFDRNPTAPCSFKTVNGPVEIFFRRPLSATLLFKTFNGQVYSDFDVNPAPSLIAVESGTHDGKFRYHSHGFTAGTAGNGGPELKFDTLNGDIRLHQNEK